jgi:RNA polymerase sigma factor (sigma-70 family)
MKAQSTENVKVAKFHRAVASAAHRKLKSSKVGSSKSAHKVVELKVAKTESQTPTPAQQEALILKYRLKARKLGRSILRRWHARLDLEEVDSIVDLSLCEAVKRFNPYKGATFMTFLFYHLKGNLVRAVSTAAHASTIPALNLEDLAAELGGESEHFLGHQFRALNASEVADALVSEDVPMPDEALWRKQLQDKSAVACEKLDMLEREIIKRIFIQEQQIMDIANSLGYSRCHISRVKKKALETLQGELRQTVDLADIGAKGENSDETLDEQSPVIQRKAVFRRRPRSKASKRNREEYYAEAA